MFVTEESSYYLCLYQMDVQYLNVQLGNNKLRQSLNWYYFTDHITDFTDHQEQDSSENRCKIDLQKHES